MRKLKEQLAAFGHYIKKQTSRLTAWMILSPIWFFVVTLALFFPLIFGLDLFLFKSFEDWKNVLVEANGLVFDLVVFGIIFALYEHYRQKHETAKKSEVEKQQRIERYQEEIDDFRGWKDKEAAYRLKGIIHRLNKEGITSIDLNGCYLARIPLVRVNLTNAGLYLANLMGTKLVGVDLTGATLESANLSKAKLLGANLHKADLTKANLLGANLQEANLTSAYLIETNLTDVNLKGAWLYGAKLHDSKGLTFESLSVCYTLFKAKGIEEKLFDSLNERKPELFDKPQYTYDEFMDQPF